ncbi:cyclic-di-AMP-binding protein CbpB [Gracilibacillus alcaliphilus]|uniref:cyclic-di-AMP-binding protein CbpB n=1 Tax=Gracilibacillus alcaliphilus TaxID=1401441 RepID=UPI00195A6343|nr:cyclic-di-AMP-binding protein CbpB [Gracilibacillus alcaliphilus]MBM7679370.1 putative transcriptional regulator [Gracilibacillus alcaliphilus]
MSSLLNNELADLSVEQLMIPAEKVAHVQVGNPIEHALLVLIESGYSSVPVLDSEYRVQGMIGKTAILKSVTGLERFEMEKLADIKVEQVMETEKPRLTRGDNFLKGLKVVINHAFTCIVDEHGQFLGILTRRAILKEVNKVMYAAQ